jgi:hypothetical protein
MAKVTSANARHVTSGKTFDTSSAEASDAALVNTARASSSEAIYANSDVTSAPVSSASACLCTSGKKAAGKRRTC